MKSKALFCLAFLCLMPALLFSGCLQTSPKNDHKMKKFRILTPEEELVILHKGTEKPFTGEYCDHKAEGIYLCKQCGAPLYTSAQKFQSHCGWPSFDDEIEGAVARIPDADGHRTEITCRSCGGHLGHVFTGEGFTPKNTRHCVNSISLDFAPTETAYFASGCFWGTEYHFEKAPGVLLTDVGYMGGTTRNPTYKQVCTGTTGHLETVKVIFDTRKTDFDTLARLFFETHDFSQTDGQGPDIGSQYLSAVFVQSPAQKETIQALIRQLAQMNYHVATEVRADAPFWPAEDYHQNYYSHKNGTPYCHIYRKIFDK